MESLPRDLDGRGGRWAVDDGEMRLVELRHDAGGAPGSSDIEKWLGSSPVTLQSWRTVKAAGDGTSVKKGDDGAISSKLKEMTGPTAIPSKKRGMSGCEGCRTSPW